MTIVTINTIILFVVHRINVVTKYESTLTKILYQIKQIEDRDGIILSDTQCLRVM